MYQKGTVQEHVDDMIEHTTIPVIVLVKKKDGTIRFCFNYGKLNYVTRKDAYNLR